MKIGDGVPNQTPNWSARWREQMRCAQVRKIRSKKNKKTLEPAAVVRDVSEARVSKLQPRARCVCALSIQPLEGSRWRLRQMGANGYGNDPGPRTLDTCAPDMENVL